METYINHKLDQEYFCMNIYIKLNLSYKINVFLRIASRISGWSAGVNVDYFLRLAYSLF